MGLNKILTILMILFISIFLYISLTTVPVIEDKIYPLTNNSSISSSEVLSFQNDIVSEYNKNFERYPPENKQLYHLFILNQSFNSTILLSYNGCIGFAFQESKTPTTTLMYLNQSQYGSFLGLPFGRGFNLNDNRYYNAYGYRYGFSTNVYDLTSDYLKELSTDYYLFDYAQYLSENAQLKQIGGENLQKLNKAAEELIKIYQSGDELDKAKATLQYYQVAEEVGYPDASAKKILEDLKNKNSTQLNASRNESPTQTKVVNEKTQSNSSNFLNQFNSFIIILIIGILIALNHFLNLRKLMKERKEIMKEMKDIYKLFYAGLNKSIEPRLLQIKSKILRQKKEEKH